MRKLLLKETELLPGYKIMVSAAMAIQDQYTGRHPNSVFPAGNEISSTAALQMKDQFSCGNDYAPKPRKPYTITKQRERWSEEEHKKFLEALKLYGRAWRKIEEHVGTKTAVQIRSHAQKFFSKVIRESSGSITSPLEAIEIPPPRPKRKPIHPYPRKLVHPLVRESPNRELSGRSSSPNLSISEQENQSPTSVLSAVGSDAFGSSGSNTLNDSLSPILSVAPAYLGGLTLSQLNSSPEENGSSSPVLATVGSVPDEQSPMNAVKLGLSPKEFSKEVSIEGASTRSLKLFGATVLVTNSQKPLSPTPGTCKSFPSDMKEGKPLPLLPLKLMHSESPSEDPKCSRKHLPNAGSGALCCMQCPDENSNGVEAGSGAHLPWCSFYGAMPFPITTCNQLEQMKMHLNSAHLEVQKQELQNEGSFTGSNSKSVNDDDNCDKSSDVETQSQGCQQLLDSEEKELGKAFELKPSENSAFSIIRASTAKHMRGFVPYKKRMARGTINCSQ